MEDKDGYIQADAARILKVSPQRILQWRQRGDLVGFTRGKGKKRWYVTQEELDAFALRPRRGPGAPRGPRKSG